MDHDDTKPTLSLTSLPVAALAQLLAKVSGYPVTAAMVEADLAAGAPANADGTINLIHFGAWLVREMERGD